MLASAQHTEFANLNETESFDFMSSREGYIQSDDGSWGYINLAIGYEFPNNVGSDTYSFIVKYASKFEPNDFYLDPPQYIIHMVGPGQYRKIGYVEGMFLYRDQIAFMSDDDVERFQPYLSIAMNNHYREEKDAEKALRRIFHEGEETRKRPERKSLESAQRHFADIARRYPYEARMDYPASVIDEAEIEADFYDESNTYEEEGEEVEEETLNELDEESLSENSEIIESEEVVSQGTPSSSNDATELEGDKSGAIVNQRPVKKLSDQHDDGINSVYQPDNLKKTHSAETPTERSSSSAYELDSEQGQIGNTKKKSVYPLVAFLTFVMAIIFIVLRKMRN